MKAADRYSQLASVSRTLLRRMADNFQRPQGGPPGFSADSAQSGSRPGRALLVAVLLVVGGVLLGLLGGVIWAAAAPRVVYQVYTLNPPTAYATNPETTAFIAADGIYTFIAVGGGALLGLAGYFLGVRRHGPVPMAGIVIGAVAAAFLARWLGPLLTGQNAFNSKLGSSKPGTLLHAPITLGAQGALAFWPVAAAFVAGGLELLSVMRARQALQADGAPASGFGRHSRQRGAGQFWRTGPRPGAAPPQPAPPQPAPPLQPQPQWQPQPQLQAQPQSQPETQPQPQPQPQAQAQPWPDQPAVRAHQHWADPAAGGRPGRPDEESPDPRD
jgi:hypothetical protein